MAQLPQTPERYLRSPRFRRDESGLSLLVIAWECDGAGGSERVIRWPVDGAGSLGEPEPGPLVPAIETLDGQGAVAAAAAEMRAASEGATLTIANGAGETELWLEREGSRLLVWAARGMAAGPAIADAPNGTWVAWHHDVREDTGERDVSKWIALRFVDADGAVHRPAAAMTDRDRDRHGEEQSFEFPSLVVGADGAVALFGRGSHDFYRQDLNASGFGPRQSLTDGSWGSRGRRVVAATLTSGELLVARRDRRAIELDVMAAPTGGAPALEPAIVDERRPVQGGAARRADPAEARGLHTYFGDIQQHSAHSDGVGSAEEVYLRARDRYADDFVALTDHESFLGKRTGPGEWRYLQEVADAFDAPGRFATLLAYEWTGKMYPGPGHKCVYLPARDLPIVSRDDVPEGAELVRRIAAIGGWAAPHHIGWTGADEAGHDPAGQPTWEICSCHGCYEHADHPLGQRGELTDQLVDVMLKKGHRFGFTASTDSHGLLWHHGEARKRDPYRTGLTAVQAPSLSREAIFTALKERRCYGTSGAKIRLDFTVGGHPMGSELDAGEHQVVGTVVGASELARVELVGATGVLASGAVDGVDGSLDVTMRFPEPGYGYLRVVQVDGEMAWSSPVFCG
ncbi:MAG: CehA/McbA family metallohydrolase [Deltaproteobacteria bacterium]|nr:CehA/McbA family metallohydrolase [Deltaproteobacteria bacterium]